MNNINKVTRINLKTSAENRDDLIQYCLFGEKAMHSYWVERCL